TLEERKWYSTEYTPPSTAKLRLMQDLHQRRNKQDDLIKTL
ncbi:23013_t:CDS:1, partial [Dentiscutata erythropus]